MIYIMILTCVDRATFSCEKKRLKQVTTATSEKSKSRTKTRDRRGRRLADMEVTATADVTETDIGGVGGGGLYFPVALEKTQNVDAL